jgi:hypothetical protein
VVVSSHLQKSLSNAEKLMIFVYKAMRNSYILPNPFRFQSRWKTNQITVMIAQSVSLGVLSLPSSMAVLGLVPYVQ